MEYPWEDAAGIVRWPARDLYLVWRVQNPRDRTLLDCLRFAGDLEQKLTAIWP
jgi:hypothetical protein